MYQGYEGGEGSKLHIFLKFITFFLWIKLWELEVCIFRDHFFHFLFTTRELLLLSYLWYNTVIGKVIRHNAIKICIIERSLLRLLLNRLHILQEYTFKMHPVTKCLSILNSKSHCVATESLRLFLLSTMKIT